MNEINLDFLSQPVSSVLNAPTTIGEQDAFLHSEIYLMTAVLSAMLNQQMGSVVEILPAYHEFVQQAHLSLPIADDLRCTLYKFYDFKKQFDQVKDVTDARWIAAQTQARRLKEALVMIESTDAIEDDDNDAKDEEAA